jgi:hypothetical protein
MEYILGRSFKYSEFYVLTEVKDVVNLKGLVVRCGRKHHAIEAAGNSFNAA